MFHDYYCGKSVLVTGHTGFKGAWLSLWLKELGAQVTGYALMPPTQPSLFECTGLAKKIHSFFGDIRDYEKLRDVVVQVKPEIVFHLAAQPLVRASYRDPVETFSVNVMGTVHVLEVIRQAGKTVRVCQIITSDKCYDNRQMGRSCREEDPMGGRDPYSASKGCAELVVGAYRRSFFSPQRISDHGVSISSVRAGNVIGGGDWGEDRIVPDCVRALSQNQPVSLRNPHAVRPWQHVLDALSGYLHLAKLQSTHFPMYADAWNFGPLEAQDLSVEELTQQIIGQWGAGSWVPAAAGKSPAKEEFREAASLRLDCSKARHLLQWQPVYDIQESIAQAAQWYQKFYRDDKFDAFTYSTQTIREFMEMAKKRACSWALPLPKEKITS